MAKQGKLETIKNITKAYATPLPTGEKWYEDRLSICNTCEFNSKNIKEENLSMLESLAFKAKKAICGGEDHCTACGCCIKRKASVKAEQCGIAKLDKKRIIEEGLSPKWLSLEVKSENSDGIKMTNITPEKGQITQEKFNFVYDLGKVKEKILTFSFSLFRDKGFEVKDYAPGCKCSVGEHRQIDTKTCEFDMQISTDSFTTGVKTSRTFNINYYVGNGRTKSIVIVFKLTKN